MDYLPKSNKGLMPPLVSNRKLTRLQRKILRSKYPNRIICLTGKMGIGRSFYINRIIRYNKKEGKKTVVVNPPPILISHSQNEKRILHFVRDNEGKELLIGTIIIEDKQKNIGIPNINKPWPQNHAKQLAKWVKNKIRFYPPHQRHPRSIKR